MRWLRRLLILAIALAPPLWVTFLPAHQFWPVGAAAFSLDGRKLATLCFARVPELRVQLRIWDMASGRERRSERRVFPYPVLTITDDERLVARSVQGGTRPLADLVGWPDRLLLESDDPNDLRVALSPDSRLLATVRHRPDWDRDTRVHLWDVASGRLIRSLDDGQFVDGLAFSAGSRLLAGVSSRLVTWKVGTDGSIAWLTSTPQYVRPFSFAPDGRTLAVPADTNTINLVDSDSGQVKGRLNYWHTDALAFSPDGRRLTVAGSQRVTIWDVRSLKQLVQFDEHLRPWRSPPSERCSAGRGSTTFNKLPTRSGLWRFHRMAGWSPRVMRTARRGSGIPPQAASSCGSITLATHRFGRA